MKKWFLIAVLLVVGASRCWAQDTINGSEHPEFISDAVAVRLYLASLDENTPYVRNLRISQLNIGTVQAALLNEIVTDFDATWRSGVTTPELDANIQKWLGRLDKVAKGNLWKILQIEKSGMHVSADDPGLTVEMRGSHRWMPAAFHPHPQGSLMGTPAYSVYQSSSTDTSYAYVQVTTSGNTNCSSATSSLCGVPAHTLSAYLCVGSPCQYGGTNYSAMIAPSAYGQVAESIAVPLSFIQNTPQPTVEQGQVQCRFAGLYFTQIFNLSLEVATTFSKNVGGSALAWKLQEWCLPIYAPPDFNPPYAFLQASHPFFVGSAVCASSTLWPGVWHCSPGLDEGIDTGLDLQYCTKNPTPF